MEMARAHKDPLTPALRTINGGSSKIFDGGEK